MEYKCTSKGKCLLNRYEDARQFRISLFKLQYNPADMVDGRNALQNVGPDRAESKLFDTLMVYLIFS